jgi:photosystem II stability/assembly factor-like uncharacterized protein
VNSRVTLLSLSLVAAPLAAQAPKPPAPVFKGIWEPVSFGEDISLREAFFVTVDKGWAAGWHGTIIHTRDAGATWTVQMGGDPQSADEPVTMLRFVDETHGWAVKDRRILRTEDGESWEDLGAAPQYLHELAMSSPMEGVAAAFLGAGTNPTTLLKTRDGGETWKPVTLCSVKLMIGGLNRELHCQVTGIQFVSPTVGYAIASHQCSGMGCDLPPILGKTEDGGDSWRFFAGPGEVAITDLYFTGEQTGIVRTSDGKLSRTTDGGATWKGLLASIGHTGKLIFADPEVGWSVEDYKVSFTMDAGTRWNSRSYVGFPTQPRAWSYPRRDRAYVVGDHGMVFRYSVVPATQPASPGSLAGQVMPVFASPLEAQVTSLETAIGEVTSAIEQVPDGGASGAEPSASTAVAKPLNKLQVLLDAVVQSLPQFATRFKNTNLLSAGLRMIATMPGELSALTSAVKEFRSAADKDGAKGALGKVAEAATALRTSTTAAFQKQQ